MGQKSFSQGFSISLCALFGCATTTPGSRPQEMSVAGHEQAARQQDQDEHGHAAQFDPSQQTSRTRCGGGAARASVDACWTSITNPTAAHLKMAESHRKQAADHRAGGSALREAEARACAGISPDDRDMSPFEHKEDITSIAPLTERVGGGKQGLGSRTMGAVVTFRAVQGMTAEWLQRVVDCHLARNASLGNVVPEMPNCPLVPNGVAARVSSSGNGFSVEIRADDSKLAKEILDRAERLK